MLLASSFTTYHILTKMKAHLTGAPVKSEGTVAQPNMTELSKTFQGNS
jgi:hypothetical protein